MTKTNLKELLKKYNSSGKGLTETEAVSALDEFGKNSIETKKPKLIYIKNLDIGSRISKYCI